MSTRNYRRVAQHGTSYDAVCIKVHRIPETGEYRVRLYLKGSRQEACDYFTDDESDARKTARHMYEHNLRNIPEKG